MSAIFISHSSKDHAAAAELKARLDAQGHKGVFLDFDPDDGIHAGRDWEQVIYEQLRVSAAVIVLCSPASMRSRWCFAEITQARAGGKRLFLVKIADCAIDGLLTDLQVIDITADREDGYRRLASGLKDAGLDPLDDFDWDGSRPPYPGLVSFEEKDAAVYFGRAGEIQDGLDRLNSLRRIETTGFAMVLGASGSGKSSLARAGLVPRLRKDPGGWIVTDPFRPRQDPFQGLSFAISAEFTKLGRPRDWQEIHKDLTVGPPALDPGNPLRAIANELRGNSEARALIVVDQFEELLAPEAQAVSGPFLRLLREAAAGADSPVVVLGTMRSDFLGAFQSHPQLSGLRFQAIPLGPMSAEGIRQVIEGPAEKGGLKFEPGLVETIAEDTAHGDALPLLAFALRELFDRFGTGDREIARDEYVVGLGGLEGALRKRAEESIDAEQLDAILKSQLREAMLKLVRLDIDGKRARKIALWKSLPDGAHELLEKLVAARLLVSAAGDGADAAANGGRTLEVAHEALFRSWDRLDHWITESAEELLLRADLQNAALGWLRRGQLADELWQGTRLGHARTTFKDPAALDPEAARFLAASAAAERQMKEASEAKERWDREQHEKRRQRILTALGAAAAAFALLSAVALVFFFQSRQNADEARYATGQAIEEKIKALVSLFQDLVLNIGEGQNAGSLCFENGPGCVYGRPIAGVERLPGAPAPILLGSLDPGSTKLADAAAGKPSSLAFVAASEWGAGHVVAYAHDGLIRDVEFRNCSQDPRPAEFARCEANLAPALRADNLAFADNALRWVLSPFTCDDSKITVAIYEDFETVTNTREIADMLARRKWVYRPLDPARGLKDQLTCVDALVWGNAWQVTDQQLLEVVEYVKGGGGLLLGGLGWSWQQFGPGASPSAPLSLEMYPANRLAATFGFAFTGDTFESGVSIRILAPEKSP